MSEPLASPAAEGSGAPLVQVRGLVKRYRTGDRTVEVLRGVDLDLRRGERIAVVGPSGAGKSTLLHILGTLDRPTEGRVTIDGADPFSLRDTDLAAFRNRRNEVAPAYDSSPSNARPHWAALIAPVPESVRRSIPTFSAGIRNMLKAASVSTSRRSEREVTAIGSTTLVLNGG